MLRLVDWVMSGLARVYAKVAAARAAPPLVITLAVAMASFVGAVGLLARR